MDRDSRKWKLKPPKGLGEYIRKNCARNSYIIFSEKLHTAACTTCGGEFDYEDLGMWFKHMRDQRKGAPGVKCPLCGREGIPKNARYGRKSLRDEGRIIWFRKKGRTTFMEMDDFVIDYNTVHPAIWIAPLQQIRLRKDQQTRWDYVEGWWSPAHWEEYKTIRVRHPHTQMYGGRKEHTHIMWDTVGEMGTDLQYADTSPIRWSRNLFDEYEDAQKLIGYLSDFLKHPSIELLEKAGFETLVKQRAAGMTTKAINIRGTSLRKILKLNGAEVRYLQGIDPSMGFMEDIGSIRKYWPACRIEDIEDVEKIFPRFIQDRKKETIERNARWDKALKMLIENNRMHLHSGRIMYLTDYADYLGWVEEMGIRKDKRVIYPKDFQKAHDELMGKRMLEKEKYENANFWRWELTITKMKEAYIADGIMIIPAGSPQDLRNESSVLNHCVRTYVERVAQGETAILFIRRVEEPEKPWFTLELSRDGRIVQCRGMYNCDYPDEVARFIKKWKQWRDKLPEVA